MGVRFGVRGASELAQAFREMGRNPTVTGRRKARRAAATVIQNAAKANLVANDSVETGALLASLSVAEDDQRRNRTIMGPRRGKVKGRIPSAYSHLVEFGTAPHWQPNRFGGIMHPGARPKPWLRPAYEQNVTLAANAYFLEMKREIEQAAKRIAGRSARRTGG